MVKISVQRLLGILLPLFMMVYNLNWKVGAIFNIFLIAFYCIYLFNGAIKKISNLCMLWSIYIVIFVVCLQIFRSYDLILSYIVGYILVAIIFLKGLDAVTVRYMISSLKIISIIQAFGVFLQFLLPNVYYAIMSILVETPTRNSIILRVQQGYYTGFSREVSLTIIFLIIGVALYISELLFDSESKNKHTKKKLFLAISILVLAILLTGKRGQPLFCLLALLITYLIYSNKRMKVLKILVIASLFFIAAAATYRYWESIPSLLRFVQLINNIYNGSNTDILTTGRTEIYDAAINLWEKNKILGIGWNNFKNSFDSNIWFSRFDVHNCYLQVLCENGYIGAIPFYILVLITIFRVFKCGLFNSSMMSSNNSLIPFYIFYIIFFLLYCITGTCLYEYSYYIIFFIAITQIEQELRRHKGEALILRRHL